MKHHTDTERRDNNTPGGRICDLPSTPAGRRLAVALMAVSALIVIGMIWATVSFAWASATARPSICAGLTADECSARMGDR